MNPNSILTPLTQSASYIHQLGEFVESRLPLRCGNPVFLRLSFHGGMLAAPGRLPWRRILSKLRSVRSETNF